MQDSSMMTLDEMISMCKINGKTKKEYEEIRNKISDKYDSLNKEEQEIMSDALEELEMTIEWME